MNFIYVIVGSCMLHPPYVTWGGIKRCESIETSTWGRKHPWSEECILHTRSSSWTRSGKFFTFCECSKLQCLGPKTSDFAYYKQSKLDHLKAWEWGYVKTTTAKVRWYNEEGMCMCMHLKKYYKVCIVCKGAAPSVAKFDGWIHLKAFEFTLWTK